MTSERLLTSWGECDAVVDRLLPAARCTIVAFDHDLQWLKFEQAARHEALSAFLGRAGSELRIVVQSARQLQQYGSRLMDLLRTHAHHFHLLEAPPQLANLSDSLLLVDGESGIVRFQRDQPRAKEILADAEACKPYLKRFEDIWAEGGTPLSGTTLGL